MDSTIHRPSLDPATRTLVDFLLNSQRDLGIEDGALYHQFPLYRGDDDELLIAPLLLATPRHGVILFGASGTNKPGVRSVKAQVEQLDQVFSAVYSRLLRSRQLRKNSRQLSFSSEAVLFSPFVEGKFELDPDSSIHPITSTEALAAFMDELDDAGLDEATFKELLSTIEGAKGLMRPAKRELPADTNSKAHRVQQLEEEIASFDQQQKRAYVSNVVGPERIRGLAGSGKTVILCMKAALTHVRDPDATICYTFYTKSLYQHIKRLITRFYRQFSDRDPDWDKIQVLHAWGGYNAPGVYFVASTKHNVAPINYQEASRAARNPFDFVCTQLLNATDLQPIFDYTFIDEGQDFPASFLRLCKAITTDERFVWAYDELQTIFHAKSPTLSDVFGTNESGEANINLTSDTVLYKCYRNPREALVSAHAIGFGIYGKIVQMLENENQWEDIGYKVNSGHCNPGEEMEIERPRENSPISISDSYPINELVLARAFPDFQQEVDFVVRSIQNDIKEGLRPDDILVATVDDRNARVYLQSIENGLSKVGIKTNNTHVDSYGLVDFSREDRVTLSTVHKAKGNEAFMVYVIGVDAAFFLPDVRSRNRLFTAMTRAKAWVRITGVGEPAGQFVAELQKAKENFPYLRFTYPSEKGLSVMKRDLRESAAREREVERLIAELQSKLPDEDIEAVLRRRAQTMNKGLSGRRKRREETK